METWQLRLSPGKRNGMWTPRKGSIAEARVHGEGRGQEEGVERCCVGNQGRVLCKEGQGLCPKGL